jgi:hypothetical protein
MLPDHDCLHLDYNDYSLEMEMELLSLSFVSAAEPEQYVVAIAPERIYVEPDPDSKPVPRFLRM